jgi:hypothetical protein
MMLNLGQWLDIWFDSDSSTPSCRDWLEQVATMAYDHLRHDHQPLISR